MCTRWVVTVALVVVLAAGASGPLAQEPSPSPPADDRATTLSVSPSSTPARGTLTLRGLSDCAVIDGHLLFTRYDGAADNVVVRSSSAPYDFAREKYRYIIRIVVPSRARPGPASVYAEPFCGPPEEYPASPTLSVRVDRSELLVTVRPRRPEVGDRLRIRVATCAGSGGTLTVRVVGGGQPRTLRAVVGADGVARVTARVAGPPGRGTVTLPRAAQECPGSTAPAAARFRVTGGPPVVPDATAGSTPTASATRPASPLRTSPVPVMTEDETPSRVRAAGRRRTAVAPQLVLAVLAAAAVAGLAAAVARRRRV